MWYVMLCGTWLSLLNFMKWDNNIIKKDIDNMYMCSANLLLRVTTTQNSDFSVYEYCPPPFKVQIFVPFCIMLHSSLIQKEEKF